MKAFKKPMVCVVEKTKTGFSGYAKEYPIFSTGQSVPELLNNLTEAAQLYFEDDGISITHANIKLEIDFKQFFEHYRILNAKVLAETINMNPTLLSQYVKGHKKPSAKQTQKILDGIHRIGRELSEINLIA